MQTPTHNPLLMKSFLKALDRSVLAAADQVADRSAEMMSVDRAAEDNNLVRLSMNRRG